MDEPTEDELHALGDVIEHIQTMWEADRDQYIEPLAEFTARGIFAAGYRLDVVAEEPEWEYGIRAEGDDEPYTDHSDDPDWLCDQITPEPGDAIVRRRKAGPWVSVQQEGAES